MRGAAKSRGEKCVCSREQKISKSRREREGRRRDVASPGKRAQKSFKSREGCEMLMCRLCAQVCRGAAVNKERRKDPGALPCPLAECASGQGWEPEEGCVVPEEGRGLREEREAGV